MSHWNYRIVQRCQVDLYGIFEIEYSIHEVYYNDAGTMHTMNKHEVSFHAGSVKDLAKMMLEALEKPVVKWDGKLNKIIELPTNDKSNKSNKLDIVNGENQDKSLETKEMQLRLLGPWDAISDWMARPVSKDKV